MKEGFRVIDGAGDVVSFLEGMVERARRGEIEAVAIATLGADGGSGQGLSFKPDVFAPWTRMVGAVAALQHSLITDELSFLP